MENYTDMMPEQKPQEIRIPPNNIDAEKSAIGSALISRMAAETLMEALSDEDFYLARHKDIFSCMQGLYNSGTPIDVITVKDALDTVGKLKNAGGIIYLTELSTYPPSVANIQYYVDIIAELSVKRRLLGVGSDIVDDAFNSEKSADSVLDNAERRIFDVSMRKRSDTLLPMSDYISDAHAKIGELMRTRGQITGVGTGFSDIDKLTSGFQGSDLIIIAARPSMGKTAFALNIATNAALRFQKSVAIFSLEMSAGQLVTRMICSEASANMQNVKTGASTDEELMRIGAVIKPLENAKIYIDDNAAINVAEMRSKCRRLKLKSGLDMIVIDYLQLMRASKKSDSRVLEVAEITRSLKILARELNIPIVLLSQLSRQPEQRADHRPNPADLRESGAIEQDADIILMLYRPEVYGESDTNVCEVIISKHRNGPTGKIFLAWMSEYTRFENSTEPMQL
ncbi:MAG: replicative DNA helicase [Clostridia bacterium]